MKNKFLIILLAAIVVVIALIIFKSGLSVSSDVDESRSFFEQFVIAGGVIVWFVLIPMSIITVFLVIEYSISIRKKTLLPESTVAAIVNILKNSQPKDALAKLSEKEDFVSIASAKVLFKKPTDWFRVRGLLEESLQEQAQRLMRKIEWLSLIGSVSPMVGLFGTVFGMIELFNSVVMAGGQPQPAQLAEGISVALVTTFWGLLIAIPALAVHGIFRQKIETLASDAVVQLENITPYLGKYTIKSKTK